MGQVVCYKLLNGTEIVGKLDEAKPGEFPEFDNPVVLDDALVFHMSAVPGPNGQPQMQLSFMPVSPMVKGQGPSRIPLNRSVIVHPIALEDSYEAGYLQATSPIALPPGGGGKIIT